MPKILTLVAIVLMSTACGGAESKSGATNSGSGEPAIDITGGNGASNAAVGNSDTSSSNNMDTRPPVVTTETFGQSAIANAELVDFPAGTGTITRLIVSESADVCSQLPVSCDQQPMGDDLILVITLFSGSDGTGSYVVEDLDEESVTAGTRVAMGGLTTLGGIAGQTAELQSGIVDVTIHEGETVSGSFEVEVDGEFLFGEFRTNSCPGFAQLSDC